MCDICSVIETIVRTFYHFNVNNFFFFFLLLLPSLDTVILAEFADAKEVEKKCKNTRNGSESQKAKQVKSAPQ